jgi:DNA-binding NarL/FixJ family response regulator
MPVSPRQGQFRILIVEDEILIALDLAAALRDLGFDVIGPAATLAAGIELLDSDAPDGALLDINLGRGETSYPLARTCMARRVWFAFVTALDPANIPQDMRELPRMAKPWTRNDLQRTMTAQFG